MMKRNDALVLVVVAATVAGCSGGGGSSATPPVPTPVATTGAPGGGTPSPTPSPSATPTATPSPVHTATPTPPTPSPIPISATVSVLSRAYPDNAGAPLPTAAPNTAQPTIDGYTPAYDISYGFHRNAVVAIVANGSLMQIPRGIGMVNPVLKNCAGGPGAGNPYIIDDTAVYQIHNHDHSGIFHFEPHSTAETFQLGSLFDIWGQPLSANGAAGISGPVHVYTYSSDDPNPVATEFTGSDPRSALVATHNDDVTIIEIGSFAPLPHFQIDPNYENFQC
jgi:hypothetical protein